MPTLPGRRPPLLLELDLTQLPVSPDADDPLGRLRTRGRPRLAPTLKALYEAADDRHVVGLVAKVGGAIPWAGMQELRLGVAAFAASGKPTVAWAESFGEGGGDMAAYVLATAFDQIWLQPGGGIALLGVGLETTFLRGALDRLGVEPQLEQRHEYKNAADRVQRTEFTPAHRESLQRLATSTFDEGVATIAAGRRLDETRVRELVDTGPRTAAEAAEVGLVDQLGYRDQVYAAVRERVAPDAGEADSVQLLFADRWRARSRRPSRPARRKPHVALVEIRGGIVSGSTRRGALGRQVGSDSVTGELRAVLADDLARAVVLRVDSPGGSAVASDTIWREVCRVREAGLPVIVSMGDAAASGGYFVACPADVIVALPSTLTGSIGVFGGKFVVSELLAKLGLSTGTVEEGARATMFSARRGFGADERARLAATIDAVYADFVTKVAQGRGRPYEEVEGLARGRVWTGRDALEVGLVDELGGLRDAVRIARDRAGLPDDAPLLPARHVPPLARLGRPKNSEDPRALAGSSLSGLESLADLSDLVDRPGITGLAAALGLPAGAALTMPGLILR